MTLYVGLVQIEFENKSRYYISDVCWCKTILIGYTVFCLISVLFNFRDFMRIAY